MPLVGNTPKVNDYSPLVSELKANSQLNLALTEECAVSAGCGCERCVKGKRRTGQVIQRALNSRHLSAVEEIKRFSQYLEFRVLSDTEPARQAHVDVPDVWLLERVSRGQREAISTPRTIGASASSRTHQTESGGTYVPANVPGKPGS